MKSTKNNLAFIFDFGGVILDWNPRYLYRQFFPGDPASMERFLAEVHFSEWNLQQDWGRPFAEAVEDLCRQFPQYCELIRAYDTRWEESISGPILGTVSLLKDLRQAGYVLYGLSNWSAEKFPLMRDRHEFFGWFETILVSGEVKIAKPDPRIYNILLESIHKEAQQCIFIDDSAANLATARQMGFQSIPFQSAEQVREELETRGLL